MSMFVRIALAILAAMLATALPASAQHATPRWTLGHLCISVHSARTLEERPAAGPWHSDVPYQYQIILYEAAGITREDSRAAAREKMQRLWASGGDWRHCSIPAARFSGDVLKYAVHRRFTDFINDAALNWQIDLNHVDSSDGRTVLDYVEAEMRSYRGAAIHPTLAYYRETLRGAGARDRREIDGIDCTHWPDAARMDRRCPRAARE